MYNGINHRKGGWDNDQSANRSLPHPVITGHETLVSQAGDAVLGGNLAPATATQHPRSTRDDRTPAPLAGR